MIEYEVKVLDNGIKEWWLNGQKHREDGPAIEGLDGSKAWYLNGKLHREDGPAVEGLNGTKEWWLNGKKVTEQDIIGHTIIIDGKEIKISNESYVNLKESLK